MARRAILIANSVAAQHTQERTEPALLRRTTNQIASTIEALPSVYSFECTQLIDKKPKKVRTAIDNAAEFAAQTQELLLIYYFGHGRLSQDDLEFVHPGQIKSKPAYLSFHAVLRQIEVHNPPKVLFVLDCCYAGAASKRFTSAGYCLMACTTPTTRAIFEENAGRPIGVFTRAFIDGLASPEASVSITDDSISVKSLFEYSKRQTQLFTSGAQEPYIVGDLGEPVTIWTASPSMIDGVSMAPQKSGYLKLYSIMRTLQLRYRKPFGDLKELYDVVLTRHLDHFLTAYKDDDGRIDERPAHWTSLRRYISFLRAIGVVDPETIELTTTGRSLVIGAETAYNSELLKLLDRYLNIHRLDRDMIRRSMQALLQRRSLPTMQNIVTDLELTSRYRINQGHLGLTLQLLGYMGAIGMPKSREQIFFPWTSEKGRSQRTAGMER